MKKPELIDAIASKTGNEKKVVASIVDSVFDTIVETMIEAKNNPKLRYSSAVKKAINS